jgi:hypothetical protein
MTQRIQYWTLVAAIGAAATVGSLSIVQASVAQDMTAPSARSSPPISTALRMVERTPLEAEIASFKAMSARALLRSAAVTAQFRAERREAATPRNSSAKE